MLRSFGWLKIPGILAFVFAASLPLFVAFGNEYTVLINTLALGLLTATVAIPLAILAAMICLRHGLMPKLLWAAVIWLAFTPTFMHVSAWDSAFGKLGWIVNLGGANNDLMRWFCAVWIHASAAIPQITLIIWFTLYRSGRSFEEHARLDADSTSVFLRITLPRLIPVLLFCAFWILVGCSREIAVTDIYRIGTVAEQIYLGYALGDLGTASTGPSLIPISAFSLSAVASTSFIALALACTLFAYLSRLTPAGEVVDRKVERASRSHSFLGLMMIAVLLLVPLTNLVIRGSKKAEMIDGTPVASYSIEHLFGVVSIVPTEFREEFYWSVVIAAISALMGLATALICVWWAKESPRFRWLLVILFSICAALPGPLIGSLILNAREWVDGSWYLWIFDRTIIPPLAANVVFCWPLACALAWIVVEDIPREVLESAKLDGASSLTRLSRMVVSGHVGILLGFLLLLFACCFGELSASQLAIPPGIDTIPRRMLGLLHSGVNDVTAGLTLVLSAMVLSICLFGYGLSSWNRANKVR